MSGGVEGAEAHAVRVERQALPAQEEEVLAGVERDRVTPEQPERVALLEGLDPRVDERRIDVLRGLSLEPEQHGLVGAVPAAGGAQGAEQLAPDAGGARQQLVALQGLDEAQGGAHRSHGVGAGWADADGEQVEDAEAHLMGSPFEVPGSPSGGERLYRIRRRGFVPCQRDTDAGTRRMPTASGGRPATNLTRALTILRLNALAEVPGTAGGHRVVRTKKGSTACLNRSRSCTSRTTPTTWSSLSAASGNTGSPTGSTSRATARRPWTSCSEAPTGDRPPAAVRASS